MISYYSIGAASVAILCIAGSLAARADAAVAVGMVNGDPKRGYSLSWRAYDSKDSAEGDSLRGCQQGARSPEVARSCKIVQRFSDQCLAVADTSKSPHASGLGWAISEQVLSAQEQALSKCRATAGPSQASACAISSAGCHGKSLTVDNLTDVIAMSPQFTEAYVERGNAYKDKGDLVRAISDYDQVIRMAPNDARGYIGRSVALDKMGELDRSLADCDQIIRLNNKEPAGYNNRGYIRSKRGDLDGALSDYDMAIRINPKLATIFENRGDIWVKKGDVDHAIAEYTEAVRLAPNDADNYYARGRLFLASGASAKALADLNQASELDPKSAYIALWFDIASQRSHLSSRLAAAAAHFDMTEWPAPLVRLYLGELTPEATFAVANESEADKKAGRICEATFYNAELLLRHDAKSDAVQLLRQSVAGCPNWFAEYTAAIVELKMLGEQP